MSSVVTELLQSVNPEDHRASNTLMAIRDSAEWRHHWPVAVLAPLSGISGVLGPSSIASAQLAIHEVNRDGGILGRKLDVVFLDCAVERTKHMTLELDGLIRQRLVSGVLAVSFYGVRDAVGDVIGGRVPFVFTPVTDKIESRANTYNIGPTTFEQLTPVCRTLLETRRLRRWAIVGKDYDSCIFSSGIAKHCIRQAGGQIVLEELIADNGLDDPTQTLARLKRSHADIVLVLLAGQDGLDFNRAFCHAGLHHRILRLSEYAGEPTLLGLGAGNTNGFLAAAPYFYSSESNRVRAFKENYHTMHGPMAPMASAMGQSLYEGVHFYAALVRQRLGYSKGPVVYSSARGGLFISNRQKANPVLIAEADGVRFSVIENLA